MLFFEMLQISLGQRFFLSHIPSGNEWEDIYSQAERQALTGILLHGIERLKNDNADLNLNISQTLLLQWIGVGQMIEQRNRILDERCVDLLKRLSDYGLHGTILKGQGIARLYDFDYDDKLNEIGTLGRLRQSGDIDVYVDCGLEKAIEFAKASEQTNNLYVYKHMHLNIWDDTEVEMHIRPEVLLNLWKNRKLQKWFKKHQNEIQGSRFKVRGGEIITPTVEFNVFYILLHIYRHFLYEGVGLRQIVDYYYVLRTIQKFESFRVQEYVEVVREFGMEKFAKGLMWVMREALGMPREWMLWEPDEKEGKYILKQVMTGGNFGHYKEREINVKGGKRTFVKICSHNLSLFTHYPYDTLWAPIYFVWLKLWQTFSHLWIFFYQKFCRNGKN